MKQAPVLTERDAKRILQHCKQTAFPDRNRCVFMLGYLAGMRIGEIAALKVGDGLSEAQGKKRRRVLPRCGDRLLRGQALRFGFRFGFGRHLGAG